MLPQYIFSIMYVPGWYFCASGPQPQFHDLPYLPPPEHPRTFRPFLYTPNPFKMSRQGGGETDLHNCFCYHNASCEMFLESMSLSQKKDRRKYKKGTMFIHSVKCWRNTVMFIRCGVLVEFSKGMVEYRSNFYTCNSMHVHATKRNLMSFDPESIQLRCLSQPDR